MLRLVIGRRDAGSVLVETPLGHPAWPWLAIRGLGVRARPGVCCW